MVQVGRFQRVRAFSAGGISPSYVLARPKAQWPATLTRYRDEDWAYDQRSGLVVPALRGGSSAWSALTQMPRVEMGYGQYSAISQNASALSTNYVYNSAGDALAVRVVPPADKTLSSVYYFVTAHTGTPEVQIDLHTDGASKPAASPTALGNSTPDGTGWKMLGSLSNALTAGTKYWIVISDNDGATDGTATILRNVTGANQVVGRSSHTAFLTTDGWATVVTAMNAVGSIVLVFSDGTVMGWPITTSTVPASNTNRRGWNISTGFPARLKLLGMLVNGTLTNTSGIEAYEGTTAPGGTTASSGAVATVDPAAAGAVNGYLFSSPYSAPANTPLRVVFTFSSSSNSLGRLNPGTGVDATLKSAVWGGGNYYYALANGTVDWSNDNADGWPLASLIIEDLWDAYDGAAFGRRRSDQMALAR